MKKILYQKKQRKGAAIKQPFKQNQTKSVLEELDFHIKVNGGINPMFHEQPE